MTPVSLLSALLLAASAQATGQMSPTSDVSQARAKATGSSVSRSLGSRFADFANVKDYGLKCDGVTDDYAAAQAMITAIGGATKTVIVTDQCVINTNLTFPATLTILKLGKGAFTGTGVLVYKGFGMGTASKNSALEIFGSNGWAQPGGNILAKFGYGGGLWIYDWASICPAPAPGFDYNSWCVPTGGAMVSIGSDLGAGGTTLAIANNNSNHDFIKIRSNDGNAGFQSGGPYRLRFTGAGLMAFGDTLSTIPALKPNGAELAVRKADDSGYATIDAAGAAFAEYDMGLCSTAVTLSPSNGASQKISVGGTCAVSVSQPTTGTEWVTLKVTNTGAYSFSMPGAQWSGGTDPTFTATTDAIDVVRCYLDGTLPYCDVVLNARGGPTVAPYAPTVLVGGTQQFTSGGSGVTWSVTGAGCGSVNASTGLYTAPTALTTGCAVVATTAKGATSNPLTLTTIAASFPFDTPGCYANGSTLNGHTIAFWRASTRACGGAGTCGNDSLCVDADGAQIDGQFYITNPIPSGVAWAVAGDFKPGASRAWDAAGTYGLWEIGFNPGDNNSSRPIVNGSTLYQGIWDAAGGYRQATTSTTGLTGSHRWFINSDLAIYLDGSSVGGAPTGAGTGTITTMPARLEIGSQGDGTSNFQGAIKNLLICTTKTRTEGGCQ